MSAENAPGSESGLHRRGKSGEGRLQQSTRRNAVFSVCFTQRNEYWIYPFALAVHVQKTVVVASTRLVTTSADAIGGAIPTLSVLGGQTFNGTTVGVDARPSVNARTQCCCMRVM